MKKISLPDTLEDILTQLARNGFQAFLVGGCVRDLLLNKVPKDWDIATNAQPQEIQQIFPESIYENNFGTVLVKTSSTQPSLKTVEITTFRKESKYSDKRHPDLITFANTIEEDLARRDFTINALALEIQNTKYDLQNNKYRIIDPFQGQSDLKKKLIRAVLDPQKRFQEDALRLLRAIRFACELNFEIEQNTFKALKQNAPLLKFIAPERIRDEFLKIINTPQAAQGILLLQQTDLLKEFLPELVEGINVSQNKHHLYDVFEHLWRSLDYAAKKNYSTEVRLASLFHDLGKPRVKQGTGKDATFYNHEVVSAKMTQQILTRLRFPTEQIEKITLLVRYHGFVYDPEITTDAALRRLLAKVGTENIKELAQLREADRIGSGCPKALPFRLRHFLFRVEKITKQLKGETPSLKILKINGFDLQNSLGLKPSPVIGLILNILLEEVLDTPAKNTKNYLLQRAQELIKLPETELKSLSEQAKLKYQQLLKEDEQKIKEKYSVS